MTEGGEERIDRDDEREADNEAQRCFRTNTLHRAVVIPDRIEAGAGCASVFEAPGVLQRDAANSAEDKASDIS